MEINLSPLLTKSLFEFSHSPAEGGPDAGKNTWKAALSGPRPLLNTPEEFEAFRDHVREFGAWDAEEIAAWDENECQALFLQMVSGDVRECPATLDGVSFESRSEAYQDAALPRPPRADSIEEIDWLEYESQTSDGKISGHLSRSGDGQVFYYLGS